MLQYECIFSLPQIREETETTMIKMLEDMCARMQNEVQVSILRLWWLF